MSKYTPKVGANRWNQLLAESRQRNVEILTTLEQLSHAAKNAETRAAIQQATIKILYNQLAIEELLKMET